MHMYMCYYCNTTADTYSQVIQHLCHNHRLDVLKYKQLELDCQTGKTGYRTKTIECVRPVSHTISVDDKNQLHVSLTIENGSENDVTSEEENYLLSDIHVHQELENNSTSELEPTPSVSNDDDKTDVSLTDIYECIPSVIETLKENGQLDLYKKWLSLVASKQFPMQNICYLLFLDVVEWFSKSSTSQMRYMHEKTLNFWKVGYRLFHGKFLRFMAGPRSCGQVVSGKHVLGDCSAQNSSINFAVPSKKIIAQDALEPILPGVFVDTMQMFAKYVGDRPIKIGIDGKKIARGKGKSMGDIDCWGFESDPTLKDRKNRFNKEFELTSKIYARVEQVEDEYIPKEFIDEIRQEVHEIIKIIGGRIKDLRESIVSLNRGIDKFMKLGNVEGKQWTKSRFAPVISTMKVQKYDVNQAIETALRLVTKILYFLSTLNGAQDLFSDSGEVDLTKQKNYNQLKHDNDTSNTHHIKHRTEVWHNIRKEACVTGSTCNKAVGLGKLKDQQAHYDQVVNGKDKEPISEEQLERMEYGTKHEIDGIATMVGRFIPAYYPDLAYYEEGCARIPFNDDTSFTVVSPDGSFKKASDSEPVFMYENKCKTHNAFSTDVYYKVPPYYIPQLLCEMKSYSCNQLLFNCWSPLSTTIFKGHFDNNTWEAIWKILCETYGSASRKRPSRFPGNIKELKQMVTDFQTKHIEFIAEIASCEASNIPADGGSSQTESSSPYICKHDSRSSDTTTDTNVAKDDMLCCFHHIQKWQKETYKLCRTSATEILVFMANDLDRQYHTEIANAHPLAYALKGSSMTNACFRNMLDHTITNCEENGLNVRATSSDGQWHKFGVRNWDEKPLTVLQLQKDIWNSERLKSKASILSELKSRCVVTKLGDVKVEKDSSAIIVTGHITDSKITIYKHPKNRYVLTENAKCIDQEIEDGMNKQETLETIEYDTHGNVLRDMESLGVSENSEFAVQFDCDSGGRTGTDKELALGYLDELNNEMIYVNDIHNFENNIYNIPTTLNEIHSEPVYIESGKDTNYDLDSTGWGIENAYSMLYNPEMDVFHPEPLPSLPVPCDTTYGFDQCGMIEDRNINSTNRNDNPVAYFSNYGNSTVENEINICSTNEEASNVIDTPAVDQQNTLTGDVTNQKGNEITIAVNSLLSELSGSRSKWVEMTIEQFSDMVGDTDKICESMTKNELLLCLDKLVTRGQNNAVFRKSWKKQKLAQTLKMILNNEVHNNVRTKRQPKIVSPAKLKKQAFDTVKKMSKEALVALLCEDKCVNLTQQWRNDMPSGLIDAGDDEEVNVELNWFSKPHVNSKGKATFHFTDCSHILTCLRTKICTTGITGLRKQAWTDAAMTDETSLNVAIVIECIDKQSVAFAKRVFGEDVEQFMMLNSYEAEANFVRLIRRWYEAEDEPGILAKDRCARRLELRSYLLEKVNFCRFPPRSQYIGGIPIVTFEALLVHIERKIQIYSYLPLSQIGYNARALGTQEVEQFFSTLRDLDPSGLGTPKPDDIPGMVAKAAYLDNIRLDPDRGFHMTTSTCTVYPEPEYQKPDEDGPTNSQNETGNHIAIRDNFFDTNARKRVKSKRKSGIVSGPDCPSKRQKGVRQYHGWMNRKYCHTCERECSIYK